MSYLTVLEFDGEECRLISLPLQICKLPADALSLREVCVGQRYRSTLGNFGRGPRINPIVWAAFRVGYYPKSWLTYQPWRLGLLMQTSVLRTVKRDRQLQQ